MALSLRVSPFATSPWHWQPASPDLDLAPKTVMREVGHVTSAVYSKYLRFMTRTNFRHGALIYQSLMTVRGETFILIERAIEPRNPT